MMLLYLQKLWFDTQKLRCYLKKNTCFDLVKEQLSYYPYFFCLSLVLGDEGPELPNVSGIWKQFMKRAPLIQMIHEPVLEGQCHWAHFTVLYLVKGVRFDTSKTEGIEGIQFQRCIHPFVIVCWNIRQSWIRQLLRNSRTFLIFEHKLSLSIRSILVKQFSYSYGHLSVISTYNPIYRMYNPIYSQL